jgi:ABC-type branched-subunit amino acid transport system ATPase component/ABC-type branched-subunit amino acid transport system permease subunit
VRGYSVILALIALAAALAAPLIAGPFWMTLITQIYIYGLLALSVDLLLGHAGLYSLCQASFFAVAAYTTAILQVRYGYPTIVAAPAGLIAGTLLAVLYGSAVRTRGVYFILITIALGYIIWGAVYRWASFTGGDNGITNVPPPSVAGVSIASQTAYYYFVLAVVILCAFGYRILIRSPFGLSLRGIKGSESRMQSLGYRTTMHLYAAFVISGAIASLAGVLYVYYNRFINPVAASFQISVEVSLMAIVGGSGTIVGPFIGAGIFLGLRNWVSSFFELHTAMIAAVAIDSLAKVFGGLRAVDGVSLQVGAGERRALIGPNGAGKTTLFHCVTGTLQPSSGSVKLFGQEVTYLPEYQRTKLGMGRTFQITNVFTDLSLAENLALAIVGTDRRKWIWNRPLDALPAIREQALAGLEAVGLRDRADEPVKLLSYGERRQLELALALNTRPKVLFLDEPCAGLSPSERQRIFKMVRALPREITLVLIEHDMDVALGLADRVTVMNRGRVMVEGTPAEVQSNPEVRDVYFGHV